MGFQASYVTFKGAFWHEVGFLGSTGELQSKLEGFKFSVLQLTET